MAAKGGQSSKEIRVHPMAWESSPESERFPLSFMGHIMPKIYVLIAEVFALPEDANTDKIVRSMTDGLEFAMSQFPVLAGILEIDAATCRMWVTKKRDATISLHIKYMLGEDEFPSYDELAVKDVRPTHTPYCFEIGYRLI